MSMNNAYLARAKKMIPDPQILSVVAAKRAKQLALGARPMIKCDSENYLDWALLEIAEGLLSYEFGTPAIQLFRPADARGRERSSRDRSVRGSMANQPVVAVLMGSKSDLPVVEGAFKVFDEFGIPYEAHAMSAHRTPVEAMGFAANAEKNGFKVVICAAGMAAHLGGVVAAHTTLPVIGIPDWRRSRSTARRAVFDRSDAARDSGSRR